MNRIQKSSRKRMSMRLRHARRPQEPGVYFVPDPDTMEPTQHANRALKCKQHAIARRKNKPLFVRGAMA